MLSCSIISCSNNSIKKEASNKRKQEKQTLSKPASTYQDTLLIDQTSAVFYHPDSLQLEKIRKIVDSNVFNATLHEYFYQMRNAKIIINKDWPHIKIIEANNARYLNFKKNNNVITIIDLDTKGDPHGLFLFQPGQDPRHADMMNIETELSRYFNTIKR